MQSKINTTKRILTKIFCILSSFYKGVPTSVMLATDIVGEEL